AWWLVAARFVQGVGGAMTSAVILGMIVTMFPDAREQAKAIGVFAFVASAGGSVGLLAGGVLTQAINWHWIFFVTLPIGVAPALAARRLVPDEPGIGLREGADVPGAVLITSALMLGVYTIVGPAAKEGWGSASTLLLGAGSIALLVAFLAAGRSGERDPGPFGRGDVRDVLPRSSVSAARARLRRASDRPRVPARHDRHGDALDPVFGADLHGAGRPSCAAGGA